MRPAYGRTASAGKHADSGAVAWLPQGTCPRPARGKPNRGLPRSDPSMFRRQPMKERLPHDVLPWAGRTPWARAHPLPAGNTWARWKIRRNHLFNWEDPGLFVPALRGIGAWDSLLVFKSGLVTLILPALFCCIGSTPEPISPPSSRFPRIVSRR